MGLWTVDAEELGDKVFLLDSVTMKPLSVPLFESLSEAEGFLRFAAEQGIDDVRRCSPDSLDRLHDAWHAAGRPTWDPDDEEDEDDADVIEAEGAEVAP